LSVEDVMGLGSIWPWLIVLVVVLLFFGRGRVSSLMGDVAHGVKSFRRGLSAEDAAPRRIEQAASEPAKRTSTGEPTNAG
jgi:sec-independent protein translocase protein TatA